MLTDSPDGLKGRRTWAGLLGSSIPVGATRPNLRPASASGFSGHLLLKVTEKASADLAKNIFWGTITGL
jgi:hypothetical protein